MARKHPIRSSARLQSAQRKLSSQMLVQAWSGAATPMTIEQDIEALKARIDKVQNDCDAWRVAGPEEKYLEAYFMVEALTLQLDKFMNHLTADRPLP